MNIKKSSARAAAAVTITTRKSTSIITNTIMNMRMKTVPAAAGMRTITNMSIIMIMHMKAVPVAADMRTIIMMNVAAAAVMIMDTCGLMTAKR